MRAGTHKLHVTGFDDDGWTGTIKDKSGRPIYNIDTNNLAKGDSIMSNKILAVDDISIKPKKYRAVGSSVHDARGDIYSFDVCFAVETNNGKESVATIRLTDEQVKRLITLLDDRFKEE